MKHKFDNHCNILNLFQIAEKLLCSPNPSENRQNSVFMARMRTFYFVFMTTVFTAITLLPYRFVGIHRALNPARKSECATILMFWVFMYMVYLNSVSATKLGMSA